MCTIFQRTLSVFLLGCSVFLTHCTRIMPENHSSGSQKISSPYTMPSAAYLALAHEKNGEEKQALMLMAAGRAIYDGQWQNGLAILSKTGPLSPNLADEKTILLAKVDLMRNHANAAITHLSTVHKADLLPLFYQAQYHDMLAYAYQHRGASVEAALERIKLDSLLPDPLSKSNNRRVLWLVLTQLSQAELDTVLVENANNPILQGWVELAEISRKNYTDPQHLFQALQQWQRQYANHPANNILPNPLKLESLQWLTSAKHMALLLPLTGPLAGPGQAIEDGFMQAYRASGQTKQLRVSFYNTDKTAVDELYQQALDEGADFIVGPLSKADVARVAKRAHPVPTIMLNDTDQTLDRLGFQFGLSPMNEAIQLAVQARYARALVIAPEGNWGNDIVQAFAQQWQSSKGQIIDSWRYRPQDNLSQGIRDLLRLPASVDERAAKGHKAQQTAAELYKGRRDFDSVILIAYPSKARQIMPLLRYYYPDNLPIYATSTVYSGAINTAKDRDLNGIIFCDMPWVFSHPMSDDEHHWAEQFNSYNRLYALGMDSYALAKQLNHLSLFPALGISEQSGVIYLSPGNQLSRILVFGQFIEGKAEKIDSNG